MLFEYEKVYCFLREVSSLLGLSITDVIHIDKECQGIGCRRFVDLTLQAYGPRGSLPMDPAEVIFRLPFAYPHHARGAFQQPTRCAALAEGVT